MYIEQHALYGEQHTIKPTMIIDDDFIPKLIKNPGDDRRLDLIFETIEDRVIIPLYVRNLDEAVKQIVSFFEKLYEETITEDPYGT